MQALCFFGVFDEYLCDLFKVTFNFAGRPLKHQLPLRRSMVYAEEGIIAVYSLLCLVHLYKIGDRFDVQFSGCSAPVFSVYLNDFSTRIHISCF